MFKKLFVCIVIAGLCCTTALAQEQKGSALSEWLKGMQKKIGKIVPKKAPPQTTGVAGVRGAKEDSAVKLYWKGKKGDEPVTEEEMSIFKEGLESASKGDRAGAIKVLEEFMKKYPDSALMPDAKKTLDLVKLEAKEEKKPEVKEEKKPEVKEETKSEAKEEKK